ncbi:uncharacterized protein ASCRUDRAFT_75121 [Ascoidea rubescens DSM 1968]|uniref:Uncharacterized protein n=1 Tax=Ascoidea rubescens DSM 1968 TaxID=1344418 RepID=A0A1D2VJR6_9ASCO|nr:hypothetical protein ASCRUDRAFT_75121 [Ascoidea rubescens DSM 1968]ODV61852.1 hypothetical protein ASCRUDRAFT_75121 [Ascoidea rubescens DSM 1968]
MNIYNDENYYIVSPENSLAKYIYTNNTNSNIDDTTNTTTATNGDNDDDEIYKKQIYYFFYNIYLYLSTLNNSIKFNVNFNSSPIMNFNNLQKKIINLLDLNQLDRLLTKNLNLYNFHIKFSNEFSITNNHVNANNVNNNLIANSLNLNNVYNLQIVPVYYYDDDNHSKAFFSILKNFLKVFDFVFNVWYIKMGLSYLYDTTNLLDYNEIEDFKNINQKNVNYELLKGQIFSNCFNLVTQEFYSQTSYLSYHALLIDRDGTMVNNYRFLYFMKSFYEDQVLPTFNKIEDLYYSSLKDKIIPYFNRFMSVNENSDNPDDMNYIFLLDNKLKIDLGGIL